MNPNEQAYFDANKALWNAKTPIHLESEFYDMKAFKAGKSSLHTIELEEVGGVKGKSFLHLQCHFGQDSLSWVREGAIVTGVDLSDAAIAQADQLSKELNLPANFICSNVYDLREHLEGQFDIVFTSYGTIGWLPDLDRWAEIIDHFLKPGGRFYIIDFHPFIWTLDEQFKEFRYDYFNTEAIEETTEGTYADRSAPISQVSYGWNHPLSEILTALLAKGLQIELVHEFPFSTWDCFPNLVKTGERKWVFKHLGAKIPYLYSIRAGKPLL